MAIVSIIYNWTWEPQADPSSNWARQEYWLFALEVYNLPYIFILRTQFSIFGRFYKILIWENISIQL